MAGLLWCTFMGMFFFTEALVSGAFVFMLLGRNCEILLVRAKVKSLPCAVVVVPSAIGFQKVVRCGRHVWYRSIFLRFRNMCNVEIMQTSTGVFSSLPSVINVFVCALQ